MILAILAAVGWVLVQNGDEPGELDEPEAVLPLLGTSGDVPARPALGVKIDTTTGGRPQTGLVQADIVFEEMVEGGLTRLLAVYHSQAPDTVGPIRSARSTDISLLDELGRPLFAWSGANPTFAEAVRAADIIDTGFAAVSDAYRRSDDRRPPYNLYAAPEELWAAATESDQEAGLPPTLFTYRAEGEALDAPGAEPAEGYAITGGELTTSIRWDWDPQTGTWLRTQDGAPHVDDEGTPVSAANVLIRATPYRDTGIRDSTGAVVPEADTVGEGDAWLLTDGKIQPGRWHKPDPDAPTTYTSQDGTPLRLTPGPSWIEVLPPNTAGAVP